MLIMSLMSVLCACGQNDTSPTVSNPDSNVGGGSGTLDNGNEDKSEENTKPSINIHTIKLQENEGVNSEGVVFDKTVKFNKHSFILPCQLDEFLEKTNSTIKDQNIISQVSKDKPIKADCYTMNNEDKINFSITIGKDLDGNNCVVGFDIKSDYRISNSQFDGTPNLISCGFEFLKCDMDNNQFLNLDKKYLAIAENRENPDGTKSYILELETAKGDYWKMTIKATSNPNVEYYFFDEISITTTK